MDPISYSKAAQQESRIKKVINEPDANSGLVTMPSTIATGETITIPAGRVVVHPNLQVDGTLDIQGDLFIPSGGSVSTTEVDATVVKQNGNVVANDSAVVHKTGDETKTGTMTFMDNVGIGVTPSAWSGFKCAEFTSGCYIGNYSSSPNLFLGSNSYFDGVNWVYKGNGYATRYQGNGDNGAHYWHTTSSGAAGNQITFKTVMTIDNSGNLLLNGGGALGYGTGSGGTVTQVGSMYDPVALNKPSGKIYTFSQGIPAGASITFNLYNTQILSIDTIVSTLAGDFSTKYELNTYIQSDGFVVFSIKNKTGGTLTESRTINFTTIKGAIA